MSVILILILASLVMATIFLVGFIWSVRSGQYDDTTTPSMRVLMEEGGGQKSERENDSRLTLTQDLSRWEKGQQVDAPDSSEASAVISDSRIPKSRRTISPLPAGEGWGEGELLANQPRSIDPEGHKRKTDFNNP